jgi:hypothetical protein
VGFVNILKLSVGSVSAEDHADWMAHTASRTPDGYPHHTTRMWPKRQAEVEAGGSLYWVIRGLVLVRQRIVRLEEVRGPDGILRCRIVLDPDCIRTEAMPKRAFQGWRYMDPADSPRDLPRSRAAETPLPQVLVSALAEIGLR